MFYTCNVFLSPIYCTDIHYVVCVQRLIYAANIKATGWVPLILQGGFIFPLHLSHVINCCSAGGLGEAVCSAMVNESGFSLHRLAVSHVPRSGKPHELLKIYGIDRDAIAQAVRKMLSSSTNAK